MNDILNAAEVAEMLDCDERTVQEKARTGELPAVKFGRSWRFPRVALLQVLNDMALCNKQTRTDSAAVMVKARRRKLPPTLPDI